MMPSTESPSMRKTEKRAASRARFGNRQWLADRARRVAGTWTGFPNRPALLPGLSLAARPGLLLLTALLLVGLCAALVRWTGLAVPDSAGIDLPADVPSFNLNNTSAEASAAPSAPALHPEPSPTAGKKEQPPVSVPLA